MRVLLLNADQIVNAIEAESIEAARSLFPEYEIIQHPTAGPGWRRVDGELVPPEPEPVPLWDEMPTHEFLALFTPQEWEAFYDARVSNPVIGQLMHILDRAPTVHRTHHLLRQGMQYAASVGLLTADRLIELIGEV